MSEDLPFMVVAFRGRLASGKTSCANAFMELFPNACTLMSFAKPLKLIAADLLPWRHEQLYGSPEEKAKIDPRFGVSCREFMQAIGKSVRTHLGDDIWIEAVMNRIALEGPRLGGLFIIDDCRYPNEAIALRGHRDFFPDPVYVIHLERLDRPDDGSTHESETGVEEQKDLAHEIVQAPIEFMTDRVIGAFMRLATPTEIQSVTKRAVPRI